MLTKEQKLIAIDKAIEFFDDDRSRWMKGQFGTTKEGYDWSPDTRYKDPVRCCILGGLGLGLQSVVDDPYEEIQPSHVEGYPDAPLPQLSVDVFNALQLELPPEAQRPGAEEFPDNYFQFLTVWKWNDSENRTFPEIKEALIKLRDYVERQEDTVAEIEEV